MEPTNLLILTFIRFHCPSFFRSVRIGFVREIFKVIKDQSSLFHKKHKLRRSKKFREKFERTKTISDKPVWEKQDDGTLLLLSGNEDYQFNITFSFENAYIEWIKTKDDFSHIELFDDMNNIILMIMILVTTEDVSKISRNNHTRFITKINEIRNSSISIEPLISETSKAMLLVDSKLYQVIPSLSSIINNNSSG